jgi:hypothetical protein
MIDRATESELTHIATFANAVNIVRSTDFDANQRRGCEYMFKNMSLKALVIWRAARIPEDESELTATSY